MSDYIQPDLSIYLAAGERSHDEGERGTPQALTPQPVRECHSGTTGPQPAMAQEPRRLTREEAAARLGLPEDTLRHWRRIGYGPASVPSITGWVYPVEQVDRLARMPRDKRMIAIARNPRGR
jgi:hypothetical protein